MVTIQQVFGNDAPLSVSRSGQIVEPRLSGYGVGELNYITDGIYMLVGCLQELVYIDTSGFTDGESGSLRQGRFRPNTDGKNHHIGLNNLSVGKNDLDTFGCFTERCHSLFEVKIYFFLHQVLVHQCRH
ncbi:hypothetical protein SDC9_121911 [bioreactor metagenome]|uniref:Uncharacterized protein n=1 Tax=bioreactor metagenome TaxID=1076179 RepID=A0A645CDH6_9ZZZZ